MSSYLQLVRRLGEASVKKHFDAYEDVDWNHRDHRVEHDDPRFALDDDDPLGATDWYRARPESEQAKIGLHLIASRMRVGIDFECVLSRGLLEMAQSLPAGAPEMRYALHEVVEEGQHSLMFQELIARIGMPVEGLYGMRLRGSRAVPALGRTFPERFFVHVLAGEAPIDFLQRRTLDRTRAVHPLLRRIMQIHVTEEARHICFAEHYLDHHVPQLGLLRRAELAFLAPFVVASTVAPMMQLPRDVVRAHNIPSSVVREVRRSPLLQRDIDEGVRPLHARLARLGLLTTATAPLWRLLGVGPRSATPVLA